jgi:hypothetical protein
MGFLDHSTNNIIVDAVLTDVGRRLLSRNDGSFSIAKFALGDDEVDYTSIEKYGRTVGKERIEKNTPVFEAQTNSNIALKHQLVSLSNPTLVRLPSFSLTATGLSGNTLSMDTATNSSRSISLEQTIQTVATIDAELVDTTFLVQLPDRFVSLQGESPDFVDVNDVAQYVLTTNGQQNAQGGSVLNFTLQTKSLTANQFTVYGTSSNKNVIEVVASVQGTRSGAQKDFLIQITKAT